MSSVYRISSPSRSARQPEQRWMSEIQQRKKPASETSLARLRAAQRRLPDEQGVAWAEPCGLSASNDIWPIADELMHDWLYEA